MPSLSFLKRNGINMIKISFRSKYIYIIVNYMYNINAFNGHMIGVEGSFLLSYVNVYVHAVFKLC
jgi:hypothetical protein